MMRRGWVKPVLIILGVLAVLGIAVGGIVWWKFFKSKDQIFAADLDRFKYGSLGGDLIAGIPYPLFMILPRVFPDLIEKHATTGYGSEKFGHGGYGAFGLAWEEGQRLPVGLSIKQLGYERVTANCSLCHTTIYRLHPNERPRFAFGGPGHTVNIQGLLRFLFAAANDDRFSATRLMPELALQFELDWVDWATYSFVLIPATRLALRLGEKQMQWMDEKTAWGPGRDDAFNLPKYVLTQSPKDDTVSNTDFPALWRLADRDGHLLHAGGEAKSVYGVIATSALGAGSLPAGDFEERNRWTEAFIRTLEPPKFPGPLDDTMVARGRELFAANCAACHAKDGAMAGKAIPLEEIGTDPEHVLAWTGADAGRMNLLVKTLGMRNAELQAAQGYVARPLVGLWLLGPYLHNGSVPTLRDLLSPPDQRPTIFYRGYDVIDLENLGFVATGSEAKAKGFRFSTADRGNGNGGHRYGTELPEQDKRALIEFAKTL